MPATIDQKLRLAVHEVKRTVAAQTPDAARGVVVFKCPEPENATFTIEGTTDTVIVRLYAVDRKPRHGPLVTVTSEIEEPDDGKIITLTYTRYAFAENKVRRILIYYTDSRDGGQTPHKAALPYWGIDQLPVRRQVKRILRRSAGIEVL